MPKRTFTGLAGAAFKVQQQDRSVPPAPTAGRVSEVDEVLSVLSDNISQLELIVSELGDKLARVMRSDAYEGNELCKAYETGLAKDVYSRALKVKELSELVYSYIRRLEI
jgi:hypothetical protein